MDYTSLVADETTSGSIKRAINWSRVDSEGILDEAQKWIYAKLRVREMLARDDVDIGEGETAADLPTGYLDPVIMSIPGVIKRVRNTDHDRFQRGLAWDSDGLLPEAVPTRFCVFDDVFNFNSRADDDYTGKILYFKRPTDLSADNPTNFLTIRYPTLLRRACLMFAAEERKDRAMMKESEDRALELIDEVKRESDFQFRGMEIDANWEEEGEG